MTQKKKKTHLSDGLGGTLCHAQPVPDDRVLDYFGEYRHGTTKSFVSARRMCRGCYRIALAEVSQQAARLKQELEVTTDNQILWQERCFDTERECAKWKAAAESREQSTLAAELGLALARASTAERALRNIAARVDRDGGQKQKFESIEDTAKRIDLVLADMIMHLSLLRAANGTEHR